MGIYKLCDLVKIKRGSSPRPIKEWLTSEGIMWAKISDIDHNYIYKTKQFVKYEWVKKGLIGKNGDLFITNSATPGIPFIQINNENIAYHDGFISLKPNEDLLLKKYLYYKLILDRPKLIKQGNGAVFINLSVDIVKKWKIYIPSLNDQKKIIDIIEPNEKLFLRYSECIRIDNYKNSCNDMNSLIDIIEPIENLLLLISKMKILIKEILVMTYKINNNERILLNDLIEIYTNKYNNQRKYVATNGIGEMILDKEKIININLENKPSRADLTPVDNSFIISKLMGENKVYYIDKYKYVFSTGFFNIKTESNDHFLGFLLSNDFINQKKNFSTGTTMVGLTNQSLENITIKKHNDKQNLYTILYDYLLKLETEILDSQKKIIKLLIK